MKLICSVVLLAVVSAASADVSHLATDQTQQAPAPAPASSQATLSQDQPQFVAQPQQQQFQAFPSVGLFPAPVQQPFPAVQFGGAPLTQQFPAAPLQQQFNPQQFQQVQPQQPLAPVTQNEPASATPVTDICLGCICQAVSNCNQTLTCNGEVCGLFRITRPYWTDASKPVQAGDHADNAGAFENCVNEPLCAARTVQNYMLKFQSDCNGDNVINCYDHASIHILGGYGCSGGLPPKYSNTLQQCLAQAQNYQG